MTEVSPVPPQISLLRHNVLTASAAVSILLSAAIFGFFYAWVCSTMWGLDTADPRVAITAMNAMNESVRNAVFAPAFFGTPVAFFLTAGLAQVFGRRDAALWFVAAGALYLLGGLVLTMGINVPLNRDLLAGGTPQDIEAARAIWTAYSTEWQIYNTLRTVASGAALALGLIGIVRLARG